MGYHDRPGRQAFAEYFAARRDVARRAAFLLCGDVDWADDLTQVAFVKVAVAWDRVRDPHALDAFVRTCLIRTLCLPKTSSGQVKRHVCIRGGCRQVDRVVGRGAWLSGPDR
jgi:DNA-directed RNA polymerase specialized sigma24 family protein